jgi:hypothetical protein
MKKTDNKYLLTLLKELFNWEPPTKEGKFCKCCGEVKPLTEFYASKWSKDGKQYRCKSCDKVQSEKYRKDNPTYLTDRQKERLLDPIEREKHLQRVQANQQSFPAGVYAISNIHTGEVIYIGESHQPYVRMIQHFSETGKKGGISEVSPIATDIGKGLLNRLDLKFEIISEADDEEERLTLEEYFIRKLKPKYNILYVTKQVNSGSLGGSLQNDIKV